MYDKNNKKILVILIIIIISSVIGFTYFIYDSKKQVKKNAIKYEEEKDKPEFNALTKKNISIYKLADTENTEYFIKFSDTHLDSSNYYPIGLDLSKDIILSKNLKDKSQLMIVNNKVFIIESRRISGSAGDGHSCSVGLWNITEIVNETEKTNITNELLKNNNNYYKINTSDLVKDEPLLK
jgi:c-di-AMP phosphodiesterase-like protein